MTVRDLIAGSFRLIGVLASGETPEASEAQDALVTLQNMLDAWSVDSLTAFTRVRESFALIGGKGSYNIGPTGDFVTARPMEIEQVGLEILTTTPISEIPVDILTDAEWASIVVKTLQSAYPTAIHPWGDFPNQRIDVWPVPNAVNNLVLYQRKPLTNVTNLNTVLSFPPGYLEAMNYNLAKRLAPEYGKTMTQDALDLAVDSYARIKRGNKRTKYLKTDAALSGRGGTFNIITGGYNR